MEEHGAVGHGSGQQAERRRAAGGCEELGRRVHHQTRAGGERDDMLERSVHGPLRRDPGERG